MLGHWILCTGRDVDAAQPYFDRALTSGRASKYVRTLHMAALQNVHSSKAELETIRVANEMRKANQSLSQRERRNIWDVYYSFLTSEVGERATGRLIGAIPAKEHLSTFHWLFDTETFDEAENLERLFYLGLLQEAANEPAEALSTLKAVQKTSLRIVYRERVDAAIKRLSRNP